MSAGSASCKHDVAAFCTCSPPLCVGLYGQEQAAACLATQQFCAWEVMTSVLIYDLLLCMCVVSVVCGGGAGET